MSGKEAQLTQLLAADDRGDGVFSSGALELISPMADAHASSIHRGRERCRPLTIVRNVSRQVSWGAWM